MTSLRDTSVEQTRSVTSARDHHGKVAIKMQRAQAPSTSTCRLRFERGAGRSVEAFTSSGDWVLGTGGAPQADQPHSLHVTYPNCLTAGPRAGDKRRSPVDRREQAFTCIARFSGANPR